MSRAFMKEHEDEPEPRITAERTQPYFVSAEGLDRLRRELDETANPRRQAELEGLIAAAVVVAPPEDRDAAGYGARVTVTDDGVDERVFTIAGDDEVDIPHGKVGLSSPLAQALAGARVGDSVVWHRPAGDLTLQVRSIEYEGSGRR
jgi:transcription elongation factor GreB